jgi:ribosomal RNA-processing protein 7
MIVVTIASPRNKRAYEEAVASKDEGNVAAGHKKLAVRSRVRRKEKELHNFYRHQVREDKREKLVNLRQKFEEDKAKIAQLKAQRKFKPF